MSLHDFSLRRHARGLLPEIGPRQRSDTIEANADGLEVLLRRLMAVRRLREHHVWEAVRLIRRGFRARARFVVGRDRHGWWVVSDRKGVVGGLFTSETAAIRFAVEASGRRPEEVCRAPEGAAIDLDTFSRPPKAGRVHS